VREVQAKSYRGLRLKRRNGIGKKGTYYGHWRTGKKLSGGSDEKKKKAGSDTLEGTSWGCAESANNEKKLRKSHAVRPGGTPGQLRAEVLKAGQLVIKNYIRGEATAPI